MNQTITRVQRQLSLFDSDNGASTEESDYTTCGGITLRYYQKEAAENCFKLWNDGSPGVLVRSATGTGKTILAASIIDRWLSLSDDHHALILTHERQLAYQFRQEAMDVLDIRVGLEMAGEFVTTMEMPRVVVASRATLLPRNKRGFDQPVSRITKFDPKKPWLIVIDEAHRYLRNGLKSCKHIFDHFDTNKESKRLGITATPMRGDKRSLRSLFPDVGYDYPLYSIKKGLASAVGDGYAVKYDQRFIIVKQVDWNNIKTVGSDFDDGDLAAALEERKTMLSFIQPTLDIVGDKKTLIFSPTVSMAQRVAYSINEELDTRNAAVSINGETPHDVRMSVYEQFERGDYQFLSVCGLCKEGYNNPSLEAVAIFRPTKSKTLSEQMRGRSCRTLPGVVDGLKTPEERIDAIAASAKPVAIIVDLVGCTGMCDTATTAHALAEGMEDEVINLANKNALNKGGSVDMGEELLEAEKQITEKRAKKEEERKQMRARAAKLAAIKAKVIYSEQRVSPGSNPGEAAKVKIPKSMPFGKHKGKMMCDVPAGYLNWLASQEWLKWTLRSAVETELKERKNKKKRKPQRYSNTPARHKNIITNNYTDCPF